MIHPRYDRGRQYISLAPTHISSSPYGGGKLEWYIKLVVSIKRKRGITFYHFLQMFYLTNILIKSASLLSEFGSVKYSIIWVKPFCFIWEMTGILFARNPGSSG